MLTGASIVFFTYIGFDSVSTAAEECRNPQRDMPIGIIATLVVCTILYGSVALVLTGIAHYDTLNNDSPVADALKALGYNRLRLMVNFGALMGMISSLLVSQYGQARIWFAMSRDGLLPRLFAKVHSTLQNAACEHVDRWAVRRDSRADSGISILSPNCRISGRCSRSLWCRPAVMVLRQNTTGPAKRGFRVPLVPLVPMLSIGCCLLLMMGLPLMTWIRFVVWLVIGLAIYFYFGRKNSIIHPAGV